MATQEYVVLISPGPAADDDDRFAARMAAAIVGDDSGSRLYWELMETGLAESAGVGPYEFQGTGIFMGFLACAPDQTAGNLQRMLDIFRKAAAEGVTAGELELAQKGSGRAADALDMASFRAGSMQKQLSIHVTR